MKEKISDLQNHIFGYQGLLFQERLSLIEPIEKKVLNAVKKVARKRKLAIVFDRSSSLLMIYSDS